MNLRKDREAIIADLAVDSAILANEHAMYRDAKERKSQAEDEIVRAIVCAVKPALVAVSSRISLPGGGVVRGISLGAVILMEDGTFCSAVNAVPVTVSDVVDQVPLSTVAAVILVAVRAQLGKLDPRTEQIRREASILEGVAAAFKIGGVR